MPQHVDELEIRRLVEAWAVHRDARDWDRFRAMWHDGQAGFDRGVRILHFLGGAVVDVAGDRAIAQTKMTITQRAPADGVLCDVVCTGRFYDFFERREQRWGLVLRQPIYEQDRCDPVEPDASPLLDPELLRRFPDGYRHLAYVQTQAGYTVKTDMPGPTGP